MRLALLSDVHGNLTALEAVLADVEAAGGADAYWIVGDLAAIGPDPVAVLERLVTLPNACFTRGNTDRYVVTGERPPPHPADVLADPTRLATFAEVQSTFAWTAGSLATSAPPAGVGPSAAAAPRAGGWAEAPGGRPPPSTTDPAAQLPQQSWLDWLSTLPLETRLTLPDQTRILAVHASPGTDDGPGVPPTATDDHLRTLVQDADADLIVVGHTHFPVDRTVYGIRVVNLGSVSNPLPPDLRASYAILTADASGHHLDHRRVPYDHAAVIAAVERVRHPAAEFIIRHQRGQRTPPWQSA